MIEKIYSKVDNSLLHIICRKSDIGYDRQDLVSDDNFLQVACFSLPNGKKFKAHKHITCPKEVKITQESWVVVQGKIKAYYYDIDDSLLQEVVLEAGDCTITLYGGHNYESLEDNSLVYEFKNGPYFGQLKDKIIIE